MPGTYAAHVAAAVERMEDGEMAEETPMGALAAALAKAQGAFPPIPRDRTVTVKMAQGGSYSFAYAPLDTILHAVRAALAANGLAITQTMGDGKLVTTLLHSGGGRLDSVLSLPQIPDMQKFGSAITYLRRYAVTALLGVAAEDDDDGNAVVGNVATPDAKARKPAPVAPAAKPAPGMSVHTKRFHAVRNECGIDEVAGKQILAEFNMSSSMDVTPENIDRICLRLKQFSGMEPPPVGTLTKPEQVKALGALVQKVVTGARPMGPLDITAAVGSVELKQTKGGPSWIIVTDKGKYTTFQPIAGQSALDSIGSVVTLRIVENRGYKNVTAVDPYTPTPEDAVDANIPPQPMPETLASMADDDIPF